MTLSLKDRRTAQRHAALSEQMVNFKFPAVPAYQLKLQDVCRSGAGVIARHDSNFLSLIQVSQEFKVKLLSPRDCYIVQGDYRVRIAHITELKEGRFKGHVVVGIELLQKFSS